MGEWRERPEYTPLPHRGKNRSTGDTEPPIAAASEDAQAFSEEDADAADVLPDSEDSASLRAPNEDDDGYDPYSDWHDQGPAPALFERDPWD
ncbi:MAG: hypothetical protein ACOX1O_05285 [Eggerthellaceae bacterium]|jgi:hypothetical protein